VSVWRRSRQFGEGAGGTEPSCRAVGWAARVTGAACGPGEISAAGAAAGRARDAPSAAPAAHLVGAARAQRRRAGGLTEAPGGAGGGLGGAGCRINRWQFRAEPQAERGSAFPLWGGRAPNSGRLRASRVIRSRDGSAPGDSRRGPVRRRRGRLEASPEPAPSCHITPRVMSSREAERRGRPRARSDKAPYRTTESARDVTAGAGAALAGAAGPCPEGSAATGGTDALDAAWGGRS